MTGRLDDHAHDPVPSADRLPAFRIGVTTGVWIIAMSTFHTGAVLAQGSSLGTTAAIAATGMLIVALIGSATAWVGAKSGLTTAMLIRRSFGERGGRLIGVALALTLGVGWFAWQLAFFGTTMGAYLPGFAGLAWLPLLIAAIVTGVSVVFGFRLLSIISLIAVPATILLSLDGVWLASRHGLSASIGAPLGFVDAIGVVVENAIVGAIMFPDLSRFSKRALSGATAAAAAYGLVGFFILMAGAIIVRADPGSGGDLPLAMRQLGVGWVGFVVLIIAQWATNKGNLYSGALSLSGATGMGQTWSVLSLAVAGLLVALMGIQDSFVPALLVLGAFIPPIAAVLVAGCITVDRRPGPLVAGGAVLVGGSISCLVDILPRPITSLIITGAIIGLAAMIEAMRIRHHR